MRSEKENTISIFSSSWGHKSLGEAVYEILKNKYPTHLNYIRAEKVGFKNYNTIYQLFPYVNKVSFKMLENKQAIKIMMQYFNLAYLKKIDKLIKTQKPKIVISAYYGFNNILEKLSKKYDFKIINIVSDPRTFHKIVLSKVAYNLVFDNLSIRRCITYNIDPKLIIKSGWFVRNSFYKTVNKHSSKKELGIDPNIFTICVIGGSEGNSGILKTLPSFLNTRKKVQVIFICGHNKSLYSSIKAFLKIIDLKKSKNTKFIVKGFVEDTYRYIQASDLIIGKAGPNLLFESVASETPFFAISHITGQEDGNLEIINKYKIGFVEEGPIKSTSLIKRIIDNPQILDDITSSIQTLSFYNKKSEFVLLNLIEKILN